MQKIIICAGMPRSGSTLHYRIVKSILSNEVDLIDLGWLVDKNLNEFLSEDKTRKETILFKTHNYLKFFSSLENNYDVKVITSYRDVRDVIVSFMAFNNNTFKETFNPYMINILISDFKNWRGFKKVHVGRYEIFSKRIDDEIDKIASFLNITLNKGSKEKIEQSVSNTSIIKNGGLKYDSESLLHTNHINSGEAQQWKKSLKKSEIGLIQYYCRDWLLEHNYVNIITPYSNGLIIKLSSVWNHLRKGTFFERIFTYNKRKNRVAVLLNGNEDSILYEVEKNVKVKLYKSSQLSLNIANGNFELAETKFVKKFLNAGDCFIDIGSNIGFFSLIASPIIGENGLIVAIEPVDGTYKRLVENITLNSFSNILPLQLAVSSTNGRSKMNVDKAGFDAWNSLGKPTEGVFFEEEEVETRLIDSIVKEHKLPKVDLIKIDVEGWEVPAFIGAKEVLSEKNAPVLLVEFTEKNSKNAGFSCKELYKLGESYGYHWYSFDLNTNKLVKAPLKQNYIYENLIAIKDLDKVKLRISKKK